MKRRRHTPEQIIRKLAEGERLLGQGQDLEEVTRHPEIRCIEPGNLRIRNWEIARNSNVTRVS
jgi:putative transposase